MSVGGTIKRLIAMDGAELGHRAVTGVRREASRLAYAVKRPVWRRDALARDFGNGDPVAAHRRLLEHFATRSPRFVIDSSRQQVYAKTIQDTFPAAMAEAIDLSLFGVKKN